MVDLFAVLEVWESVTGRTLTGAHRNQFLARGEVRELAQFGRRELYSSGIRVRRHVKSKGAILRLDEWLVVIRRGTPTEVTNAAGRLLSPAQLFSSGLLGRIVDSNDQDAILRHRAISEIMKYSRTAIVQACMGLPTVIQPDDVPVRLLQKLRELEKRASGLNYDPLVGRNDRHGHRPSAVGDRSSKRIGPIQRYDDDD
jgi:hypothetical protein